MTGGPARALTAHGLLGADAVLDSGTVLRSGELPGAQAHPVVVFVLDPDRLTEAPDRHGVLAAALGAYGGIEVVDEARQAARLVLGKRRVDPAAVDLVLMGCLFERDGRLVGTAAGAAVGHPAADAGARLTSASGVTSPLLAVTRGLTASVEVAGARSLTAVFSGLGRAGCALRS